MKRLCTVLCVLAVILVVAGCAPSNQIVYNVAASPGPWTAVIARDIAKRAGRHDKVYFKNLGGDARDVSELMTQVTASGIATNYAEHFASTSPTSAVLDYGVWAGADTPTYFAVELRMIDQKWIVGRIHLVR